MQDVHEVADRLTNEMRRVLTLTTRQLDMFDPDRPTIFIDPGYRVNSATIKGLQSRGLAGKFYDGNLPLTALGVEVVKAVSNG